MPHPRHEQIRQLYNFRCGYCGVDETTVGSDHYQPRAAGGTDDLGNLVYACIKCNQCKGDYWPSDEEQAVGMYVLHPRRHNASLHFRENETTGELAPLTDTGKFHIALLHLNRLPLLAHRLAHRASEIVRQRVILLQTQIEQREETIKELEEYINVLNALIAAMSRPDR
jgi:HNH endonuclease